MSNRRTKFDKARDKASAEKRLREAIPPGAVVFTVDRGRTRAGICLVDVFTMHFTVDRASARAGICLVDVFTMHFTGEHAVWLSGYLRDACGFRWSEARECLAVPPRFDKFGERAVIEALAALPGIPTFSHIHL